MSSVSHFLSHLSAAARRGGALSTGTHRRGGEGRPSAEVVEVMTRLERLVGEWCPGFNILAHLGQIQDFFRSGVNTKKKDLSDLRPI